MTDCATVHVGGDKSTRGPFFVIAAVSEPAFIGVVKTWWRPLRFWSFSVLATLATVLTFPAWASPTPTKTDVGTIATRAPVRLGDKELFSLSIEEKAAAVRASAASRVLDAAVHRGETAVVSQMKGEVARISVGSAFLVELNQADAKAAGHRDVRDYAADTSRRVRVALLEEKNRRVLASRVLSVSSVVFFGFVSWMLIGFVGRAARRTALRIERDKSSVGAIQVGELELLPAAAARDALRLSIFGGLWLVRFGLFYFWILAALSLFESTRPLAGRATGFLFAPALDLLGQMIARLPLLLALLLTFGAVLLVVRFVTLYCAGIERREIQSTWIRPETARTSGTLLVVALCLAALLFVSPLFAGNADGSLPRIGLLLMGAIALGATPFLGSCLLGIRAVYENAWRRGDLIDYGGQRGRVEEVGLYDVTLRGEDGAQLRVPHLMSLWHPTRIYPEEPSARMTEAEPPATGSAGLSGTGMTGSEHVSD